MNQTKTPVATKDNSDWALLVLTIGKGVAIAFFTLLLLLLFSAVAISQGSISEENMKGAVLASVFLSALCGGVYTLNKSSKKGILIGVLLGGLLFLLLFILGLCIYPQFSMRNGGGEELFACVCGGAVSKFLIRKKKKIIKNTKKS